VRRGFLWKLEDRYGPPRSDHSKVKDRLHCKYVGCPVTRASKIQMETSLSNTEAELIAMSEGLRTTIPLMSILEELSEQDIWLINKRAGVHCRVFKDISGALTIANCQNQGSYQTHKQQILALQGVHGARYNHHTCSILSK